VTKNSDREHPATEVPPEMSQLMNQPHGAAGQPMNRPPEEGHQGKTAIQPEDPSQSPTQAVTHNYPAQIVDTEYAHTRVSAGSASGSGRVKGDDSRDEKKRSRGH
jgi:hypothetical protein